MNYLNSNLEYIDDFEEINTKIRESGWGNLAANASSYTKTQEVFDLARYASNGQSAEMKRKMLEDKFILKDLAILGQWTVIYAPPNAGKTLITLKMIIDSITSGEINGKDIFYINADDTYKGFQSKLEIAEKHNFYMLRPGENGFEVNKFTKYLQQMIKEGSARGKIVILDTLKKFVDLMDKSLCRGFATCIRDFVSAGGSVIALAHVNKHKGEDGKSVAAGTSDIKDDCDCCYVVDVGDPDAALKTVVFRNEKSRGDVAQKVTFRYCNKKGSSYLGILESIQTLSEHQARVLQKLNAANDLLKANHNIISSITDSIKAGITLKTPLIEHVHKSIGISKSKITKALEQHTGRDFTGGHRWIVTIGDKNAQTYSLLEMKESSVM